MAYEEAFCLLCSSLMRPKEGNQLKTYQNALLPFEINHMNVHVYRYLNRAFCLNPFPGMKITQYSVWFKVDSIKPKCCLFDTSVRNVS